MSEIQISIDEKLKSVKGKVEELSLDCETSSAKCPPGPPGPPGKPGNDGGTRYTHLL